MNDPVRTAIVSAPLRDVVRDHIQNINLILLVPHGRSGSVLMQSLLEGHPQVIEFPYWFKSYSWRIRVDDTPELLVDRFCAQRSLFGGEALQLASNRDDHGSIDIDAFKQELVAVLRWADPTAIDTFTRLIMQAVEE